MGISFHNHSHFQAQDSSAVQHCSNEAEHDIGLGYFCKTRKEIILAHKEGETVERGDDWMEVRII